MSLEERDTQIRELNSQYELEKTDLMKTIRDKNDDYYQTLKD